MLADDLHDPGPRSPITLTRLLLVEGKDQFYFFKALLRHLRLLKTIEIRNYGGRGQLADYLNVLPAIDGFLGVTSMGIVQDAECDPAGAFDAVRGALESARSRHPSEPRWERLSVPAEPILKAGEAPTVSVFLLPDPGTPGMLEDLCLRSVQEEAALPCVETYFTCLGDRQVRISANVAKARLHAFLASRPRPDLLVGQAAEADYFPWDSPAFRPLQQFLRAL
jgi:hypothetical protein